MITLGPILVQYSSGAPVAAPYFQLDMSINLTTIIGVVVWIVTIAVAWSKFSSRIDMIEYRVGELEKAMIKIAATLELLSKNNTDLALVKQQVVTLETNYTNLNARVDGLSRGEGFVQSGRRGNVDGEYSRTG